MFSSRFQFSKEVEPSFQRKKGFADHLHSHIMIPTHWLWQWIEM